MSNITWPILRNFLQKFHDMDIHDPAELQDCQGDLARINFKIANKEVSFISSSELRLAFIELQYKMSLLPREFDEQGWLELMDEFISYIMSKLFDNLSETGFINFDKYQKVYPDCDVFHLKDQRLIVVSNDQVCLYNTEEAFYEGQPDKTMNIIMGE